MMINRLKEYSFFLLRVPNWVSCQTAIDSGDEFSQSSNLEVVQYVRKALEVLGKWEILKIDNNYSALSHNQIPLTEIPYDPSVYQDQPACAAVEKYCEQNSTESFHGVFKGFTKIISADLYEDDVEDDGEWVWAFDILNVSYSNATHHLCVLNRSDIWAPVSQHGVAHDFAAENSARFENCFNEICELGFTLETEEETGYSLRKRFRHYNRREILQKHYPGDAFERVKMFSWEDCNSTSEGDGGPGVPPISDPVL